MSLIESQHKDSIELVPYDAQWPEMAAREIEVLGAALPRAQILDIQHVGSTAIPGMLAKPIIDIQIAVVSLADIKPLAISALEQLHYQYWRENPDLERLFFAKGLPPLGAGRTHHVHIVEPGSKHWQEKMLFRDYLLGHPEVRLEYAALKQDLALHYTHDRERYTEAKTEFIHHILHLARTKS
jgi:GrpB-like predicted nucleotidyltransferase (UPF0157 family)